MSDRTKAKHDPKAVWDYHRMPIEDALAYGGKIRLPVYSDVAVVPEPSDGVIDAEFNILEFVVYVGTTDKGVHYYSIRCGDVEVQRIYD